MSQSDSEFIPTHWHISRWSKDPYSMGSWSQLLVNASPTDRKILGSPFSHNLILAGEACDEEFPAMVHGAMNSGINSAKWCLSELNSTSKSSIKHTSTNNISSQVVIIGAGASGIAAANYIHKEDPSISIIILEARDRIGGRINTISIDNIAIDAGATWLHHAIDNPLYPIAKANRNTLIESDFNHPLNACQDGVVDDIRGMMSRLGMEAERMINEENNGADICLQDALKHYIDSLSTKDKRTALMALEEIRADSGVDFDRISGKYALEEPGVGAGDFYIKEGYISILQTMLHPNHISIRLNTIIENIDWSDNNQVIITTSNGEKFIANKCISTLPISIYKNKKVHFNPPLPFHLQSILNRMDMSICDKVILKFSRRWWPVSPGGILHWFGASPKDTNWIEWLDLTDGVGEPVVMAFIAGTQAVDKFHGYLSDEEIALDAAAALKHWAECVIRDNENAPHIEQDHKEHLETNYCANQHKSSVDNVLHYNHYTEAPSRQLPPQYHPTMRRSKKSSFSGEFSLADFKLSTEETFDAVSRFLNCGYRLSTYN